MRMQEQLLSAAQRMRGDRVGRREYDRLCERLLAYTEAKAKIKASGLSSAHTKAAISLLYVRTGGNRWVSQRELDRIILEASHE